MAKSRSSSKVVAILLVVGVLGITALAAYVKFAPAQRIPDDLRRPPAEASPKQTPGEVEHVQVIQPHAKGPHLTFTHDQTDVPEGADPMVTAINGFLARCPFVPKNARALSVSVKDGIAVVDVSNSFEMSYGTTDEAALLQGLQRSMGQFKDVKTVIFAVGGRPIDSLGSVEINNGITVIRPDGSEPTTPSAAPMSPAPH